MANTPPTLAEWKAIILNPNGDFCDEFKRLIRMSSLLYQLFSYVFEADGKTPTAPFLATLTGVTASPATVAPGQVVGLSASSGLAGYTSLVWQAITGATKYYIYRSTTDTCPAETSSIGNSNSTGYADSVSDPVNPPTPTTQYNYWVRAWNSIGYGPASALAIGSCVAGSGTVFNVTATQVVTVPSGVTRATIKVWGAGGGGGHGLKLYQPGSWVPIGSPVEPAGATLGGGGGGGGYAIVTEYAVTTGEDVSVYIGDFGQPDAAGGETYVMYGGVKVVGATGGSKGEQTAGGVGGIKSVGDSEVAGGVGTAGSNSLYGIGARPGSYADLPSGSVLGNGGNGGGSASGYGVSQPTYGQKGYAIVTFIA